MTPRRQPVPGAHNCVQRVGKRTPRLPRGVSQARAGARWWSLMTLVIMMRKGGARVPAQRPPWRVAWAAHTGSAAPGCAAVAVDA